MTLACISTFPDKSEDSSTLIQSELALVIPAAYHASKHINSPAKGGSLATMNSHNAVLYPDLDEDGQRGLKYISRGTAILLLGVYVAYLVFQLKTHASLFNPVRKQRREPCEPDEAAQVVEEEEEETPRMSIAAGGVG
jgi:Ca2+:H+ antiporter